jgi:hypothetical protein
VLPEVGPRARRRERRLVAKVGKVVVTVAAAVADDREDRFDKVGGTERLTAALTEELTSTGRFDAGSPEVLQVTVTSYRMRSGAAVFMAGMMAGGDSMEVQVAVTDGTATFKQFKTGAGGVAGGLDQQSRFDRVAKAVAERVVAQL